MEWHKEKAVVLRRRCTERHYSRKEVRPVEQTRAHSVQWIKVSKYIVTFFHSYTVSGKYGLIGRNRCLMHIIKYAASLMSHIQTSRHRIRSIWSQI